MSSFLSPDGAHRRLQVLVAGLAVSALASLGVSTPTWAAEPSPPAAAAAAAAAVDPTNLADDVAKIKAAGAILVNPDSDMLLADDQGFVLILWRAAKEGSYVKAAALRAYTSEDTMAAYEFIVTGIFTAAADDAQVEIAAAQAKALRRSVAVTVGLDSADTALVDLDDKNFIFAVWQRTKEGSFVNAAAKAAVAAGTTQQDWTEFLTTGAAAARQLDIEKQIKDATDEEAARIRAQQLADAKKSLLQLLLLPVTQTLVDAPNRQYVLHVKDNAKGTEVKLAAQTALNAPDAEVDKALADFIFTGGAAANKRDEDAAAAKELAGYTSRTTAVRDAAKVDGQQPNLVAAANRALTTGTAPALQNFLLKGQDDAVAADRNRLATTVHTIPAQHSNLCLAVAGAGTGNGDKIIQWTCNGGTEQDWRLRARSGGRYEIRNDHSKMCMAIGAGSKENSAPVVQWPCRDATVDQSWQLTKLANGYTQLRNGNSGQCMAIGAASKENGAAVIQYPCLSGHAEQSWNIKTRTPGKRIQNKYSGLCLSNAGDLAKGATIVQTACNDTNHTEWHLNTLSNGNTEIRNDRTNLCLAIAADSKENAARAVQWTCGGVSQLEQNWKLTTISGQLEIRNANSDLCLAIGGALKTDGADSMQWTCNGKAEQRWVTLGN